MDKRRLGTVRNLPSIIIRRCIDSNVDVVVVAVVGAAGIVVDAEVERVPSLLLGVLRVENVGDELIHVEVSFSGAY